MENQRLFLAETEVARGWRRYDRDRGSSAFLTDASVSAARRVAVPVEWSSIVYDIVYATFVRGELIQNEKIWIRQRFGKFRHNLREYRLENLIISHGKKKFRFRLSYFRQSNFLFQCVIIIITLRFSSGICIS